MKSDRLWIYAFIFSLALCSFARAADRLVPSQYPTIQAAITASVNGDTVIVSPGIYNELINIGARNIIVRSTLGSGATIIDPQGAGGNAVTSTSAAANGWRLDGFTIRNGLTSALSLSGVTCTIANCVFQNNVAARGGAADIRASANVTFDGCQFNQNKATSGVYRGGAIYAEASTLLMTHCGFNGNIVEQNTSWQSSGTYSSEGGSLYQSSSNVTMRFCAVSSSTARVWSSSSSYNATVNHFGHGGFCFVTGGSLTIEDSELSACRGLSEFPVVSTPNYYSQDYLIARGGAIYSTSSATVTLRRTNVSATSAESTGAGSNNGYGYAYPSSFGGVIWQDSGTTTLDTVTATNVQVVRTFTGIYGGAQPSCGGFAYQGGGSLTLTNCEVTAANAPEGGGAIYSQTSGALSITGSDFLNCATSAGSGGAIACAAVATTTISTTRFEGCTATSGDGGAVRLYGGTRNFGNCQFINNTSQGASVRRGGAVYADTAAATNFTDCELSGNLVKATGDNASQTVYGGACAMVTATPRYTRCTFTGNRALASGSGTGYRRAEGGACSDFDSDAVYTDCTFSSNTAETTGTGTRYARGGCVSLSSSDSDFVRCVLDGGSCLPLASVESRGGAVYMENVSRPGFSYSTLVGNDGQEGGALSVHNSEPYLVGTTLSQNTASGSGGAMFVDSTSTPYVLNCHFEQNAAASGGAIKSTGTGTNVPFVVNSQLCGNTPDTFSGGILGGEGNEVLASCSTDCNANGIADAVEISGGAPDIDGNGQLDSCQLDCNSNGIPDAYELGQNLQPDCNGNGTPDSCDVGSGISADTNSNGAPDECELTSARLVPYEYATISAAITAAVNGDTIHVAPGAYYEKFSLGTKNLKLLSIGGAAVTYLDGNGVNGTLLTISGGQTSATIVDGFTFWYAQAGSGLYVAGSSPTIRNCRFLYNSTNDGAAIYITGTSSPQILDCLVNANTGTNGAGVYSTSSPTFTRVFFTNNVVSGSGGAAYLTSGTPKFVECEFRSNRAQGAGDHAGGGAYASATLNLQFTGCLFADNLVQSSGDNATRTALGGAFAANNCTTSGASPPVALLDCELTGNIARATGNGSGDRYAFGGAVYDNNSDLRATDSVLTGNQAEATSTSLRTAQGGGWWANASDPLILRCDFVNNTAPATAGGIGLGGALYFQAGSNGAVDDCRIIGGNAQRGGGMYLVGNSQPEVRYTELSGISASTTGGAVHANGAPGFFFDCDFRFNQCPSGSALFGEGTIGPIVYASRFCGNAGVDAVGISTLNSCTESTYCADCNANGAEDAADIAAGAADCDANGVPDSCQPDVDGDAAIDACDGCPNDPAKIAPGACGCGIVDGDADGDGLANCDDGCPSDPTKSAPGACGCGNPDTDSDGDGSADCIDGCPADPLKSAPGICGCEVSEVDSDGDGSPNCVDGCPADPSKTSPGACGCGTADADADSDGTADCNDSCPNDPGKTLPGACGCGVADLDTDGDQIADCIDNCQSTANPSQEDCDNNGVGDACSAPVDCDGNGALDICDIVAGAADVDGDGVLDSCETDCNSNAIPDDFELEQGTAADCNLNALIDSCEVAAGTASDTDGDGVLDECEVDCNGNGIMDLVDIAAGAPDCNQDQVLDACQDGSTVRQSLTTPWGAGAPALLTINGVPSATAPVTLRVEVVGDLDALNEFATLRINGTAVATMFGTSGNHCPGVPDVYTYSIGASQWNAMIAAGPVEFRVEAPVTVGAADCASSRTVLLLNYQNALSDCDGNGVSDLCEIAVESQPDCDGDHEPDGCATTAGTAPDCDGNAVPDSCDIEQGTAVDCDEDGLPDSCEVTNGSEPDCNGNGIPDSCDVASGQSVDCNGDGIPDSCQVADGSATDCNGNGIPDSCDIASGAVSDCNSNLVPDGCDVASGTSQDVDSNGVPDECKADCNANGLPDAWEVAQGLVADCNSNGQPDSCDIVNGAPDCNLNGVPDSCDIASNSSHDVNANGLPDDCEVDCNATGIPDTYEVAQGLVPDCNANAIPDSCDLATGTADCNANGIIDSCDLASGEPDKNMNQVPDTCEFAQGDFDLDGRVGGGDLGFMLALWGLADPPVGDFNGNGFVDGADLAVLLGRWTP